MPARTRACSECRKKRIKCDGTLPHCLMCIRSHKVCPGPLQGPLIVDMTASARHGMKKRRTLTQMGLCRDQYIQINRHISEAPVRATVIEAFYANFLANFTVEGEHQSIGNKLTWLQRLPHLATDSSNGALILALEATATAYGAIMSSQTALNKQARALYGTALRIHHGVLQKSGSQHNITIHMVSTSVLFSFFEAMQATTADAYRTHIYGTAQLLEATGPGECGYGVLCQLFYHVRTQLLFVRLASDYRIAPISSKKILYDTLQYERPPMIQRLMCYIAALETHTGGSDTEFALLKAQVDQLWSEYRQEAHGQHKTINTDSDAFTAFTTAFFSSAYILLAMHSPCGLDSVDLDHHFQLILTTASYLDTDRNAIAFMRMSTPLLLVALHGQHQTCRSKAISRFETWSGRSMRGISALALDAVRRQEGKSNQSAIV